MQITSAHNPLLQSIRRAAKAGRPTEDGLIVVEGPHLVEEALRGNWRVDSIFTTSEGRNRYAGLLQNASIKIVEVSSRAFSSIAATEANQEILALLQPREYTWNQMATDPALIVGLDGVQDPGNAGTIVRSAEAFGASGLSLINNSVRLANGKFLRATAGSIFRMPYQEGFSSQTFLNSARNDHLSLYALVPKGGTEIASLKFGRNCVLIVGSEGAGVSPELLAASEPISITTHRVESLNAAVACSIALFEASRRRAS